MLGTRAPSPALSAKREQHLRLMLERSERAMHAGAGEGARALRNNTPVSNADDFLGKAALHSFESTPSLR
jgi:hypothetical protein